MQAAELNNDIYSASGDRRQREASFELLIQIALETGKMRYADFLKLSDEQAERIPDTIELRGEASEY